MGVVEVDDVQPRSSIEKAPIIEPEDEPPPAFDRLPDEIITQYAYMLSSWDYRDANLVILLGSCKSPIPTCLRL
jgi:hypothetical protein